MERPVPIELPPLPYDRSALEPYLSARALDHHRGHHRIQLENVAALAAGTPLADLPLAQLVREAQGALFEHAAQASNLDFYWRCLRPVAAGGGGEPGGRLAALLTRRFGDLPRFCRDFDAAALSVAGSGWVWLLQRRDGSLAIASTANAGTPLTGEDVPVLACSVWEHAYYLDHGEARERYLDAYWTVVDWEFANAQLR